jgi:hypothetical protein
MFGRSKPQSSDAKRAVPSFVSIASWAFLEFTHYVQQAVVLFPSAKQAGAFFIASVQPGETFRK